MTEGTSDLIISISIAISGVITAFLPKRIKWGWKLLVGLGMAIVLSIGGHIVVRWLIG